MSYVLVLQRNVWLGKLSSVCNDPFVFLKALNLPSKEAVTVFFKNSFVSETKVPKLIFPDFRHLRIETKFWEREIQAAYRDV